MKVLMMILVLMVELSAVSTHELVGKWQALREVMNHGTLTIEKEYLTLNRNGTFSILIFVSVRKGEAFIKDLRIEGSGIWKVWENTLVIVVKQVDVPKAGEIYLISQSSLRNLAATFKRKYENKPIRISKIMALDQKNLRLINEEEVETAYKR
ncbi:MAG: hypothetical protein COB07_02215 [Sulfurovum sp.]|nr:MAG: hypothetical protein COB07_02215 [Sulfurovum sp.]